MHRSSICCISRQLSTPKLKSNSIKPIPAYSSTDWQIESKPNTSSCIIFIWTQPLKHYITLSFHNFKLSLLFSHALSNLLQCVLESFCNRARRLTAKTFWIPIWNYPLQKALRYYFRSYQRPTNAILFLSKSAPHLNYF